MTNWRVELASDVPPWRQIVESVLDALAAGELDAGDKLPSVRGMAAEALVNHNTAARAYRDLEHLQVVEGQNGRGVFVTQGGPRIACQMRKARTLLAFQRALEEALRAGHQLGDLLAIVDTQRKRTA
jgi:GntR family transcriptional regulator